MLAAASRPTHAQNFDAVVGERVAAVARQASRAGQPARRFDLTLDDAVQRALERNLDIAVQRIQPLVQDLRVAAAGAAFLPVASSGFDFNQETMPNRFVFDGGGLRGQPIVSDRGAYDLGIESIRERIEAATASRELAERQLEAEESKFEVGLSTNFFVLQSQRDLANAQDAELRAILDYQRALIEFDRTQRASLGAAGIAVVGGAIEGGAGAIY